MEAWVEQGDALQAEAVAAIPEPRPSDVQAVVATGRTWQAAMDRLEWGRGDLLVVGSSRTGLRHPVVPRVQRHQDPARLTGPGDGGALIANRDET